MSLADDIEVSIRGSGSRCSIRLAITDLSPEDAAALEAALANRRIPASAIATALGKRGIDIGDTSIARHRRGGCKCP